MKIQRGNRICRFASAALLVALLSAPIAFGQVFGRISGTAKDPTGSVVPGVSVTATNTETGIKSTTLTEVAGVTLATSTNRPSGVTAICELSGSESWRLVGRITSPTGAS